MNCSQTLYDIENSILKTLYESDNASNNIIIYDIDDTLIKSDGTPIWPIIRTFYYAKQKGIQTAIITARQGNPENVARTIDQLAQYGLTGYSSIYFRQPNCVDYYKYKLTCRYDIHMNNFKAIISIGDSDWDIGAYGGIGYKVPVF